MISQRRKSVETSVVASEKLAVVSHATERAWWRLMLSTDAYGTIDITDIRRVRLAILGEVDGFGTNASLEDAITDLIAVGLFAEWTQEWRERTRRFLHVIGNDERQTVSWIRDRNRSDTRTSPVPPFDCCEHAVEFAVREDIAVAVSGLRCVAPHCAALRRTAPHGSNSAWELGAPHCAATPSRAEVRSNEAAGLGIPAWGLPTLTEVERQEAAAEEERLVAALRSAGTPLDLNRHRLAARAAAGIGPQEGSPATAEAFDTPPCSPTTDGEPHAHALEESA